MRKAINIILFSVFFLSSSAYSFAADKEKELNKKLNVLEQAIDQESQQIDALRKDVRGLLREKEQIKFDSQEKVKTIERLKKQVDDLRSDSGISDKASPSLSQIKEKDNQIEELETKLSESQKSLKRTQKQMDRATQENEEFLSQVTSLKKKIEVLSKPSDEAQISSSALKDKDAEIEDLKYKLAVSQKAAEGLKKDLSSSQDREDDMAKKVKETSDKIDQLKSSVKQETAKGDSFSGNSGTSGSRTASLDNLENIKNDLSASQDREAKLSEQLKEANDKIEQMKSESRHSALIESDKKDRERDQDRSDDKDKAKAINDLHKELAKSLEREVGLNKDIKDLKKQLDKARESGSKASVDREVNQDDLKKEIQDTNQKIEGFSRKLSNDVDYSTLNAQELQEKAQEIERMRQAIESAIARLGVLISSITPAQ